MRRLALGLLLALGLSGSAMAQMCGGGNCVAPTPPTGANNDQIATTAYVNNVLNAGIALPTGKIFVGSAGGIATPQTVTGDCTLSTLGALTCTKTNGAAFAPVATSGSATDLTTGTLPAARLPNPSASTLGGIQSLTCGANQWLNTISTSGIPACAQPAITDVSGLGAGVAAFLGTPTSSNLAAAVTNETGSGALVFATSPTLVTPSLGVATATSINGVVLNNNAWSTYTPTVTSVSGTLNTYTATGRYKIIGKMLFVHTSVTITDFGSATQGLKITAPPGVSFPTGANMVLSATNNGGAGIGGYVREAVYGDLLVMALSTIANTTYYVGGTVEID